MVECQYCHAHECTSGNCRCYFLNTGEYYVCANCHRTESPVFISEFILKNDEKFKFYSGIQQIFMEISQKFHLADFIAEAAYLEYIEVKKKLGKSTKSLDYLISHHVVVVYSNRSKYHLLKVFVTSIVCKL